MTTPRTGSGDSGYTDLLGGRRVAKFDVVPEALGDVDEVTSALGVAKAALPIGAQHTLVRAHVEHAQQDLYQLMAEIAFPADHAQANRIGALHIAWLESTIDEVQAAVELPNRFILPGETRESAGLDLARAVVRRAERAVVRVLHAAAADPARGYPTNPSLAAYLNRLSLLLYVLARYEDTIANVAPKLAGQLEATD